MIRVLTQASSTIASAAILVGFFSLVSRVLGFVRDRVLAATFSGAELDAYFQAFRVPDIVFQLFVSGALSASFIPLFANYWYSDKSAVAWRYTNRVLLLALGSLFFMGVMALLHVRQIVSLLAPGFPEPVQAMTASLFIPLFLVQLFFAVSFVMGSALQATKRFFFVSLAPLLYNAGILLGVWWFSPRFGVLSLGIGVIAGALAHMALQLYGAWRLGYRPAVSSPMGDRDIWLTITQATPRVLGLAVAQLSYLGMMTAATFFPAGTVRNLTFAYNMNMLPIGIVAISYAIAAFPTFSAAVAKEDYKAADEALSLVLRQVLFFLVPATALILMLRAQLIRAAYGAGSFSWQDTLATADHLAYFVVTLSAQGIVYVLVRYLHAHGRVYGPVFAGVCAVVAQVASTWWLWRGIGPGALSIGFSVASVVQVAVLTVFVVRRTRFFAVNRLLQSLAIMSSAGFFAAFAAQMAKTVYGQLVPITTFWSVLAQIFLASCTGIVLYGALCAWLRSPELFSFIAGFRARFLRAAKPVEIIDSTTSA